MKINSVVDDVLGGHTELAVSELYSVEFKTAFRGYDRQRVRGFLARVADAYESLQREVIQLREQNTELREQTSALRALEQSLSEALSGAQRAGEVTLEQARREADLIREEARLIKSEAESRHAAVPEALREEIALLRSERAHLKADLRAVLDIHRALLNDDDSGGDSVEFVPGDHHYSRSGAAPDRETRGDEGDDS